MFKSCAQITGFCRCGVYFFHLNQRVPDICIVYCSNNECLYRHVVDKDKDKDSPLVILVTDSRFIINQTFVSMG